MRIAIVHNAVPADAPPEDRDTLVQVEAVAGVLARLGHETTAVPCTLDLAALHARLSHDRPDLAFNLVESLAEADSLAYLATAVLDVLGIPYAGSRTESLFLTAHKTLAKERLRGAGLPTADWTEDGRVAAGATWILKGVWDQGSRGMDDDAVLADADPNELAERLSQRTARTGRPCFAERYIEGREFNVGLLAGPNGPAALPPAEIEFKAFPPGKPRIVGHRAKWQTESFEYRNTVRRLDFDAADRPLLERLQTLALQCWPLFRLRGWVRVDFRVDAAGRPWILEVNANPCLSPDAGYAAMLDRASIAFDEAMRRIVADSAR